MIINVRIKPFWNWRKDCVANNRHTDVAEPRNTIEVPGIGELPYPARISTPFDADFVPVKS